MVLLSSEPRTRRNTYTQIPATVVTKIIANGLVNNDPKSPSSKKSASTLLSRFLESHKELEGYK